ncbi:type II toxin-antitoxin system ParD family antitoxin [Chamaesiphon sp. OTE_75_metabat_556]|uniref:ribbon-helix-helix domain-containing protein n=1 Tax=Chamaesiphon sp. OTE_75_metabat_556 TaxID=2964692 RepID=UPI00286B13D6|nr:type II toxin-antitoxin system ParD family antitoxin [Chamaesiphon sp. OTE_75_metabat_556]
MTYLTIALPEAVKAYVDGQISSGNYGSADEFLTALIEREQERQAKQKVNAMLRSTLQKNRTIEATDEWWEQQHQYLNGLPPQT